MDGLVPSPWGQVVRGVAPRAGCRCFAPPSAGRSRHVQVRPRARVAIECEAETDAIRRAFLVAVRSSR